MTEKKKNIIMFLVIYSSVSKVQHQQKLSSFPLHPIWDVLQRYVILVYMYKECTAAATASAMMMLKEAVGFRLLLWMFFSHRGGMGLLCRRTPTTFYVLPLTFIPIGCFCFQRILSTSGYTDNREANALSALSTAGEAHRRI